MIFILHIAVALTLVVSGALASVLHWNVPELDKFSFLIGAITAQLWLFGWALVLRARRVPRFDMVVASELLIALGIFSLITGIVISGITALHYADRITGTPWRLLQTVLSPFGEGLFASGLAPLLASMLRQIEVLRYGVGDDVRADDQPDLTELAGRVRGAIKALDDFASAWKRSEVILEGASATLMTSANVYALATEQIDKSLMDLADEIAKSSLRGAGGVKKALLSLSGEMTTSGERVARDLSSTGDSLNEALNRATRGINGILDRAETRLKDLNGRTDVTARAFEELTTQTRALSSAATEGTTLLTGLQKLIESVTNFIRPGDARAS